MNFFKSKVAGYFQRAHSQGEGLNTLANRKRQNSSDTFQVLEECQEYRQMMERQQAALLKEPTRYEIIENEYFNDIVVERQQEAHVLTEEQWQTIVQKHSYEGICKKNLIFSILKGIPYNVRRELWEVLADTQKMKSSFKTSYRQLLNQPNCKSLDVIRKDVPRTHIGQKYSQQLQNILVAYSNLDPCGYTQGMNLIVGSLLQLLTIENDRSLQALNFEIVELEFQERVFWVLVGIMYGKNWRECFEGMKGVIRMLQVLEQLMEKFVPAILQQIRKHDLDLNLCFSQYYLTLVIYNTPLCLAKRILDMFLLQGEQAIHSVILRMLKICQQEILSISDMGQLIQFFKKKMLEHCAQLLKTEKNAANSLQDFALNFFNVSIE